jgi:hypothetical protein
MAAEEYGARARMLMLRAPRVSICGTDVKGERGCGLSQKYVVFLVRVEDQEDSWLLHKRFSQFQSLDAKLRARFKVIPRFPSAQQLQSIFLQLDAGFVNRRKIALQEYLQALVKVLLCSN